jgi:hypothetical protein
MIGDLGQLTKLVNDKIKTGYEPFGNLVVVSGAGGFGLYQPMVMKTHDLTPPRTR